MKVVTALLLSVSVSACLSGVPRASELIVAPTGDVLGAARVRFDIQARIDESISLEVIYPAKDEAGNMADGAPFPAIVIVQGGLVTADRYRWLGVHFATRGYVTVLPGHFAELAIFEADNARLALAGLENEARRRNIISQVVTADSRAVVMGHSLGGVIATFNWTANDRFAGLALLASYPASSDGLERRAGAPVLSITGGQDGRTSVDEARAGFQRFGEPRLFAVVDGMTHYDWTDAPNHNELRSDGQVVRPTEESRADAFNVLDAWLDATLKDDASALDRVFPNVTVER